MVIVLDHGLRGGTCRAASLQAFADGPLPVQSGTDQTYAIGQMHLDRAGGGRAPRALFARWEPRAAGRGRQPLLDPRLRSTPGYIAGSVIAHVYFIGFTRVWLVLALFLRDGLGYSPLRAGLSVTPFAIGVATSAVIAGRLVPRLGRWLTACGLTAMVVGLLTTALLLRHTTGGSAEWLIIGPLLVAGLGGGMVTSPNVTLTLEDVPVRMAGAAGGALQTVQRIGAAIGTATPATIFYHVLNQTAHDYQAAVSDALLGTCAFMLLSLLIALGEVTWRRHHLADRSPASPNEARQHAGARSHRSPVLQWHE